MSLEEGMNNYVQSIGQSMNNTPTTSLVDNMNTGVIESLSNSKRKYSQLTQYSSDSEDDFESDSDTSNKPAKDPRIRTLRHTMTPYLATKGIIAFNLNYNINPNQKWDIKVLLAIFAGSGAIVRIEDIRNSNNIPGDFIIIYLDHIECNKGFEMMSMCKNLPFNIRKTIVLESKYPKIPNILFVNYRDGFPKGFNIELCEPMIRDVPFTFNPGTVKQRKLDYKNRYGQDFPDDPKHYSNGRTPHMYIYGISKEQKEVNENGGHSVNSRNNVHSTNNKNSARFLEEKKRQEEEQLLLEEQERNSFFASNNIQQISRYNLLNKSGTSTGSQQNLKSFPDVLLKASETLPPFEKDKFIRKNTDELDLPVLEKVEKTLSLYEPPQIIQTISTLKNLIKPLTFNMESRRVVEQQIKDFLTSKEEILHSISQVFYEFGLIDLKNITQMIQNGQVRDQQVPTKAPSQKDSSPESLIQSKLDHLPLQQQEMYKRVLKLTPQEIQQLPQDQQILVNNMRKEYL